MIRNISAIDITKKVEKLCIEANLRLTEDVCNSIENASQKETSQTGKKIFETMKQNMQIAKEKEIPICQDTGMAIVFVEIGQDVHITDGNFEESINEGVKNGYLNGGLRCSIVGDPLIRKNTNNNTPAIIHTQIVAGDKLKITVAPKGFGSENMSRLKMFNPSAEPKDIIDFIVGTVKIAGSNPCPPVVVGVGIGGSFEKCAILAKKALTLPLESSHDIELYNNMKKEALDQINKLDIGPQGLGGSITALSVNILTHPTHIAGLPVAVNIGCHVNRHAECEI